MIKTALYVVGAFCNVIAFSAFIWWYWIDSVAVNTINAHWYGADKVDRARFRVGETAYLAREFCASREVNVDTSRRLMTVDGKIGVSIPASNGALKEGCFMFVYGLPIPVGLPPDKYIYRVTMRVEVNAVRDRTVTIDSPPIEVAD